MKRIVVAILLAFVILLVGCSPAELPVDTPSQEVQNSAQVYPESDNSHSWSTNARVNVPTQVYKLVVKIFSEQQNHTEIHGQGSAFTYNGYGSASMRIWQDGKGLLPVIVKSISPEFPVIVNGDFIVLKTSDLKSMGLPENSVTTFVCNHDVEILSPVISDQTLTTDRLTDELDNCRMVNPSFNFEQ